MDYEYILSPDGELYHHGVKGMKWGVRKTPAQRMRDRRARQDEARAKRTIERRAGLKNTVSQNQKEAADRIKFYGGKNAAQRAIREEAAYNSRVEVGKGVCKGILSGIGGMYVGLAAGANTAGLAVFAGAGAAIPAALTVAAIAHINKHANDQIMYTKDSAAAGDMVVTTRKRNDD